MSLDFSKKTYEKLGREDPFYAVLTVDKFRHNKWDVDEFFATGQREITEVLGYVDVRGVTVAKGRALDFGCGVGRLSQALADHFSEVVGIDIAQSMIDRARELNKHGDRVSYMVNSVDNLGLLDTASLDFIYSSITLQHIPPDASRKYIAEFLRVLRPAGVAVFQVPNGKAYRDGSFAARWYRIRRTYIRRFWKIIRGKPPYEMHYIPRGDVEAIVTSAGGRVVDVVDVGGTRRGLNFRYCVVKQVAP